MTNDRLTKIEASTRGVTQGPWKPVGDIYVYAPIGMVADRPLNEDEEWITRARGVGRGATRDEQVRNITFMAEARTAVPELCTAVRRLNTECERLIGENTRLAREVAFYRALAERTERNHAD